jgi:hypothetical protein
MTSLVLTAGSEVNPITVRQYHLGERILARLEAGGKTIAAQEQTEETARSS